MEWAIMANPKNPISEKSACSMTPGALGILEITLMVGILNPIA